MPDMSVLRFEIEGEWWAFEIAEFFAAIDELYADIALLFTASDLEEKANEAGTTNPFLLRSRARQLRSVIIDGSVRSADFLRQDGFIVEDSCGVERPVALQLLSFQYGSEGWGDFLGIGKVMEAVATIYKATLEYAGGGANRKEKRLEHIDDLVAQMGKAGYSEAEQQAFRSELLAKENSAFRRFVKDKRAKEVKLLPPPDNAEKRLPPPYNI